MGLIPTNAAHHGVELADVFKHHGQSYCQQHTLTPEQYKVFNAISNCRTHVLGGHQQQCDHCGRLQYAYNSCRNRHCPKCESFKAAQWLATRQDELLPVPYFHVVFTLPHELNQLVMYNKTLMYNLLFSATWETLHSLGKDEKRLNGEMGMLAILHTWGQNLSQHNHLHCVVPGGALQDNSQWNRVKSHKYLFPVKVMSKLFRALYVSKLRQAYNDKQLKLPDTLVPITFDNLLDTLMAKAWVVYAKPPFAGPEQLLNYLGRYSHKIAIANHRILSCDDEAVTFKWRDYADGNKEKVMSLAPPEFIRRFLSHVLPSGFMRIRSFGFLANACKALKIPLIHKALDYPVKHKAEKPTTAELMFKLTGKDITLCPACHQGQLHTVAVLPVTLGTSTLDTS